MSKLQFAQDPECVFSTVGNIEEAVIVLLLIVDCRHDCPCENQTQSAHFIGKERIALQIVMAASKNQILVVKKHLLAVAHCQ